MNELQIFDSSEFGQIRTLQINNEPWFVASDICKSLDIKNTTQAVQRLDDDEKSMFNIGLSGGDTNCVNEYGLYSLVLASKKKEAKAFKRWITHEVLPSIRKHGVYAIDEVLQNPDMLISALQNLKAEREKNKELQSTVQQMDKVICDMTPKVDYADRILSSTNCVLVTQIAQDYGMSAKTFNSILGKLGIQHKVGEQWILYAEHQGKGYVKTKTHEYKKANGNTGTKQSTVWTQKGRMFLYHILKENGFYPDIEQEKGA